MPITEGTEAPDITLPDQDGLQRSLHDFRGKWVLLYFYPKDDTSGCTAEACALRDHFQELKDRVEILGVSADSEESHRAFRGKYDLPFTLLADPKREVISLYGATKEDLGKRISFLIDPEGNIRKMYLGVVPEAHAEEVIADLTMMQR